MPIAGIVKAAETVIGVGAGIAQASQGKKIYNQGEANYNAAMQSRTDYAGGGALQSEYNNLQLGQGGRSSLTTMLEQQSKGVMANYLDAVRTSSVSSAQLQGGAQGVARQYGQDMYGASIAGLQDQRGQEQQRRMLAGQLADNDRYAYDANVMTPYQQRLEHANGQIGYGMNMRNAGIAGITGSLAAGIGAFDPADWKGNGNGGGGNKGNGGGGGGFRMGAPNK